MYCVPEGTSTLKVAGNTLKVGLCPAKDDWLPGSTGNVVNGTGGASHIAVGFTAVLAAAYVAAWTYQVYFNLNKVTDNEKFFIYFTNVTITHFEYYYSLL